MKKTNWDDYYNNPSSLSRFTRKNTENWLIEQINNFENKERYLNIAEFGGGNSCFHDQILDKCNIKTYTIYDNNEVGIEKFLDKYYSNNISKAVKCDLLSENIDNKQYDIVFSVGLIEHFDERGTEVIIKKHFDTLRDGGLVIITAPTPTLLYQLIRKFAEFLKVWKFHDERPLESNEIIKNVDKYGIILNDKILWLTGLTQYAVVIKKSIKRIDSCQRKL